MTIGGVQFDLKVTFLIILATVVPMLDYYGHKLTSTKAYDRLIWYFIIPMLVILLLFQESPADYGLFCGLWPASQGCSNITRHEHRRKSGASFI